MPIELDDTDSHSPRSSTSKTESSTPPPNMTSSQCTSPTTNTSPATTPTTLKPSTPLQNEELLNVLSQPASLKRKRDAETNSATEGGSPIGDTQSQKIRLIFSPSTSPEGSLIRMVTTNVAKKHAAKPTNPFLPQWQSTAKTTVADGLTRVMKLHINKKRLEEAVLRHEKASVTEETQVAGDDLPNMDSAMSNTSSRPNGDVSRNSLETSTKATPTATRQVEPAPPHNTPATPRRIVISLPKFQLPPPISPTLSSSTVDSPFADNTRAASISPVTSPNAAPQPNDISGLPLKTA
jgi:hypothetical protein